MRTAAELLQLAERCEREGPSWDLSIEIELAIVSGATHSALEGTTIYADGRHYNAPAYTNSIDAAVTLVPESCHWRAESPGYAEVGPDEFFHSDATAKTVALALCAAALKAMAAING